LKSSRSRAQARHRRPHRLRAEAGLAAIRSRT